MPRRPFSSRDKCPHIHEQQQVVLPAERGQDQRLSADLPLRLPHTSMCQSRLVPEILTPKFCLLEITVEVRACAGTEWRALL